MTGRNGVGDRARPGGADFFDRAPHANCINLRRSGERPDYDRNVIVPSMGIDNISEKKGAALIFRNAAQKLPANEWMQLRVFIDRPVDSNEQAIRFELGQMRLEIKAWPAIQRFKIRSALA